MILENTGSLMHLPRRIISLVPSQTELLYHLGLENETVGITKFCVHPAVWHQTKLKVGGTKKVNMKTVQSLGPDLIIANREENVKEQAEALAAQYPLWVTNVNSLESALQMINDIGALTGRTEQADIIVNEIRAGFNALRREISNPLMRLQEEKTRAAYLIWKDPYMAAGGGTFIHSMMEQCGFENIFSAMPRYPQVSLPMLDEAGCGLVFLSSEPYPFGEEHAWAIQKQLPRARIILVNGEMFSWYGSRMLEAPEYFKSLLKRI